MLKLKVGDEVIVISGKDKGKIGKVKRLNISKKKALVSDVNFASKSIKPNQDNPDGGFLDVEKSIDISNIALLSPKTKKASRVRIILDESGKKKTASCM